MMPLIEQALTMGYGEEQILSFLSNVYPKFQRGIKDAKKLGYQANQILNFLSNTQKKPSKQDLSPGDKYLKESGILTKEEREERRKKGLQTALGIGAGVLGAAGLGRLAFPGTEAVRAVLEPALDEQQQKQIPYQQNNQIPPERQITTPTPSGQPIEMGIGGFFPPEEKKQPQSFADKILEGIDLASLPEGRQQNIGFLKMVADKLQSQGLSPSDPKFQGILRKLRHQAKSKLSIGEQEEERFKKEYPDREVITEDGNLAEIVDEKGKTAKIIEDGKEKIVPGFSINGPPDNKDDILDLYERLIQAIPESERSAVINWAGYDPEKKKFAVRFHTGDAYTYEDIPDEFAKRIEEAGFLAKTTGGNYFGEWSEGEASRGAGLSKLIRELQAYYGGKGKEYSGKFKTVYSYLGEAERKLKEKQQREKEKKRKKR